MPHITRALLRKRSEHNEGIISTMEELTLHQEEIEEINEVIGATCRRLKILYFQNNLIPKLENLNHLRELEYLNMALNNITKIEGLQNCEHIKKLDFTANFIDLDELEASMDHLATRDRLRELYMMGNPCQADWPSFTNYVIARLPQLETLDGVQITKSMEIQAAQQLPRMQAELRKLAVECRIKKAAKKKAREEAAINPKPKPKPKAKSASTASDIGGPLDRPIVADLDQPEDINATYTYDSDGEAIEEVGLDRPDPADKDQELTENTPEVRREIYIEIAQQKKEKQDREDINKPKERDYEKEHKEMLEAVRGKENQLAEKDIKQKNEAGYSFYWDEERKNDYVDLHIQLPKHLDSSLVDVDCHPTYVSVVIKTKLLRLTLPCEVRSSEVTCKRSKLTGELVVHMPKVNPKETTVFVTVDKQKSAADRFKASAQRNAKPTAVTHSVNSNDSKGIKMPSVSRWTDGGLTVASSTVYAVGEDGAFDASPDAPVVAPGTNMKVPVSRSRVIRTKKLSIQDEILAAAAEAAAATKVVESGAALKAGITVVGETSN